MIMDNLDKAEAHTITAIWTADKGTQTMTDVICECPKCGRQHRDLGFGKPPSIMEQIAHDIREGTFPKKSEATSEWQKRPEVTFTYKNYRGETSVRLVRPIMVAFGTTGFHPEPQWLLHGWDINKDAERTFAMKDIQDWEAAP